MADVEVVDNTQLIKEAKDLAIERALEIIGGKAAGYAILLCRVDTGLLRNSITYAVDGNPFSVQNYKADHPKEGSKMKEGAYGAEMPKEEDSSKRSVTVGTNVEYAGYQEFGTMKITPQPFIVPSVRDHVQEYRGDLMTELKKEGF